MKFALINDKKEEATKGAKGCCPVCGSELIARCGEVKINHWAHKGNRNCDPWWETESEWHRKWKEQFPVDWQEVVHYADNGEKHIADVKTQNDWVIEFQHSYLNPEERRARTGFYRKLIWVVDGTRRKRDIEQFKRVLNEGKTIPVKSPVYRVRCDECTLLQEWPDCHVPVFFDFGGDQVLWYLLYGDSQSFAYVAQIPIAYFIKIHNSEMTQKAKNFDDFVKEIKVIIKEYDSYLRRRRV